MFASSSSLIGNMLRHLVLVKYPLTNIKVIGVVSARKPTFAIIGMHSWFFYTKIKSKGIYEFGKLLGHEYMFPTEERVEWKRKRKENKEK